MARKKLQQVDDSTTHQAKNDSQTKMSNAKIHSQRKRKTNECEKNEEPIRKKKSKPSSIKSSDIKDTQMINKDTVNNAEKSTKYGIKRKKLPDQINNSSENDVKTVSNKVPRQTKSKNPSKTKGLQKETINKSEMVKQTSKAPVKKKSKPTSEKKSETVRRKASKVDSKTSEMDIVESGGNLIDGKLTHNISEILISNKKLSPVKKEPKMENDSDSSSEEEWEEVEENNVLNLEDYKPEIPKEGVEITIDCPELKLHKRKKKEFDWQDFVRLNINRQRKEMQLNIHKTHLLCLLAHGFYVNNILNSSILKGMALSLLPADMLGVFSGKKVDKIDIDGIENVVKWFCKTFTFEQEKGSFINFSESIVSYFENHHSLSVTEFNLMFVVLARTLGLKTRFCISLYALTHKANNLIKKSKPKKEDDDSKGLDDGKLTNDKDAGPSRVKKDKPNSKVNNKVSNTQKKKVKDEKTTAKTKKTSRPKRSIEKNYKLSDAESDKDDDEDYELSSDDCFEERKPVRKSLAKPPEPKTNRKVLSSDSEPPSPETLNFNNGEIVCWAEVFSKPDKQWISVECVNNIVNTPYAIEDILPKPVTYIVAFDNDSFVKDVTRRYCSDYMTSTIRLRADSDWWDETLMPFSPPDSKLDKDEESKLENLLINKPLPTTVAGFKNHPLYALKRHLLKFEAIYPPDAQPIGYMRKELVYPRECVCQLHSRETWCKEARVVRIGEEPYKIVKARPKWDRIAGVMRTDLPLEVFGFWQTEPYEPPIAVDGKVPRNAYGNVELFKPCMLPRGTVHLQLPGLNRVAKKLGIDCSPAVVGFDGHKGSVHAVFDGFIICEEFKDTIIAAWEEEQVNAQRREQEKREKRIYGNWRKLIRGLLIRERIKLKYDAK